MSISTLERFTAADLNYRHKWVVDRLLQAYPHHTERSVIGWLRGITESNLFLCLRQDQAVAVAEVSTPDTLAADRVVSERFVFLQDRLNKAQARQALEFYDEMLRWAKGMDVDRVIILQLSDVPEDIARKHFETLHEMKIRYLRA